VKLPNNFARCDGLLPKVVTMPNGMAGKLWVIDCPKRDTCARFLQMERDNPGQLYAYTTHIHGPADACPDYIHE
jgi:hypothetical protein